MRDAGHRPAHNFLSERDMRKNTPVCADCDEHPERLLLLTVLTLMKAMQDAHDKACITANDPAKEEQTIDLLYDLAALSLVICNNVILPFLKEIDEATAPSVGLPN